MTGFFRTRWVAATSPFTFLSTPEVLLLVAAMVAAAALAAMASLEPKSPLASLAIATAAAPAAFGSATATISCHLWTRAAASPPSILSRGLPSPLVMSTGSSCCCCCTVLLDKSNSISWMMAVTLFMVAFWSGSLTSMTKLLSGSRVKFMGTLKCKGPSYAAFSAPNWNSSRSAMAMSVQLAERKRDLKERRPASMDACHSSKFSSCTSKGSRGATGPSTPCNEGWPKLRRW
mmetsp:Transcript_2222/g.5677  ORF Transcript_2222/g.5677 Transcript_2222/m.5677 type:complete len:232 (+) Transcript_2222:1522-2217(+)